MAPGSCSQALLRRSKGLCIYFYIAMILLGLKVCLHRCANEYGGLVRVLTRGEIISFIPISFLRTTSFALSSLATSFRFIAKAYLLSMSPPTRRADQRRSWRKAKSGARLPGQFDDVLYDMRNWVRNANVVDSGYWYRR
jgi:hypothetical protein